MYVYPAEFFEDRRYRVDTRLCFVLMPFSEPWSDGVHAAIQSAVTDAGYSCRRADDDVGRIVLRDVWRRINAAAFLVADLTAFNPNVYYELGIAHTVGTPVIPIAQRGTTVPFDQAAFRALMYEPAPPDYPDLRDELPRWIETLEPAPVVLLKTGRVGEFNDWRGGQRQIRFGGEDLSDAELSGVDLGRAQLSETSFAGADLTGANLERANLIRADLRHARLGEAALARANVSEADLEGADLTGADLRDVTALRVELTGCRLDGADVNHLRIDLDTFGRFEAAFERTRNRDRIVVER